MKKIEFYWLPNCSTCQKAKNFIERHGIREYELRDIKENPLSRAEVEKMAKMLGGAENLFSKRAIKYREMKLNERTLSNAEMLDLMTDEYTFLKRPILVIDGKAEAGFFEKFMNKFLDENYYK
ncbi:MAG TPA: Spx/MgsR family RNA polymerase-binding regulatory protein [Pyrinomonadaceae bacterium]|nr:Spx/MgsR family RNA polymerase-binding regulatory protein [Pyrinomonadaceae bacterium]